MSKLDEIRERISMIKCVAEDGRTLDLLEVLTLLADELERVDKTANEMLAEMEDAADGTPLTGVDT